MRKAINGLMVLVSDELEAGIPSRVICLFSAIV